MRGNESVIAMSCDFKLIFFVGIVVGNVVVIVVVVIVIVVDVVGSKNVVVVDVIAGLVKSRNMNQSR